MSSFGSLRNLAFGRPKIISEDGASRSRSRSPSRACSVVRSGSEQSASPPRGPPIDLGPLDPGQTSALPLDPEKGRSSQGSASSSQGAGLAFSPAEIDDLLKESKEAPAESKEEESKKAEEEAAEEEVMWFEEKDPAVRRQKQFESMLDFLDDEWAAHQCSWGPDGHLWVRKAKPEKGWQKSAITRSVVNSWRPNCQVCVWSEADVTKYRNA